MPMQQLYESAAAFHIIPVDVPGQPVVPTRGEITGARSLTLGNKTFEIHGWAGIHAVNARTLRQAL